MIASMDSDVVMGLETDLCDEHEMRCYPHCLDYTLYFRVLKTKPRAWKTVSRSLAASTRLGQSAMCISVHRAVGQISAGKPIVSCLFACTYELVHVLDDLIALPLEALDAGLCVWRALFELAYPIMPPSGVSFSQPVALSEGVKLLVDKCVFSQRQVAVVRQKRAAT